MAHMPYAQQFLGNSSRPNHDSQSSYWLFSMFLTCADYVFFKVNDPKEEKKVVHCPAGLLVAKKMEPIMEEEE